MKSWKSKIIGFDLDDVLLNFNDALLPYHNHHFGTSYEREHIKSFNLSVLWGCSESEVIERVLNFYQSPEHRDASPVEGAVQAIRNLKKRHKLFIVTARHEEIKEETLGWVDKHFPKMFEAVHFTNHFYGNKKRGKGEVCVELGIEIFVDDSINNAKDITNFGIPVLLFDTPWNQTEVNEPINRVYSWEEIEKHINE